MLSMFVIAATVCGLKNYFMRVLYGRSVLYKSIIYAQGLENPEKPKVMISRTPETKIRDNNAKCASHYFALTEPSTYPTLRSLKGQ